LGNVVHPKPGSSRRQLNNFSANEILLAVVDCQNSRRPGRQAAWLAAFGGLLDTLGYLIKSCYLAWERGNAGVLDQLNTVKHSTLERQVYSEILQAIVSGRLSPGSSVTITELAEGLNVSLMPVRTALKALEAKNLIQIQKNRRLTIRKLSIQDLQELFEIRIKLEVAAAQEAARRCPPETLAFLERALGEMKDCQDRELYLERNLAFHRAVYQSAGKPILCEIIDDLWHRISPYMYLYLKIDVHSHDPFHEGLAAALRAGDPEQAGRWLETDLSNSARELAERLRSLPGC
jgi:DNA-binding GntR family transcriptional regulator